MLNPNNYYCLKICRFLFRSEKCSTSHNQVVCYQKPVESKQTTTNNVGRNNTWTLLNDISQLVLVAYDQLTRCLVTFNTMCLIVLTFYVIGVQV